MRLKEAEIKIGNLEQVNADGEKERQRLQLEIERLNTILKATNGNMVDQINKLNAEIEALQRRNEQLDAELLALGREKEKEA